MNRFIARLDSEPQPQKRESQNAFGFQVLRNKNDDLQLEPWFDFIIGINGRTIVGTPNAATASVWEAHRG